MPKPQPKMFQPSQLGGRFNRPQLSANFFKLGSVMAEKLYFEVRKKKLFLQKIEKLLFPIVKKRWRYMRLVIDQFPDI